jgi:histidinol-phosphatase
MFLQTAIQAAREGEAIIRRYYQNAIPVHLKADQTPVTVADVETEQAIKRVLQEAFPKHGFFGEETGKSRPDAEFVWLIDPIDGTKSFVRRYPFFSTQIALMHGDTFVLGVSNAPLFDELAYAEVGGGAFLNDQPVHVSAVNQWNEATLSFGNIQSLARDDRWCAVGKLIPQFNRTRGFGDFYHYHLLAAGKIDVVIESDVNILDVAALAVIIQEAGGQITDLIGNPLTLDTTSMLASNGHFHEPVLKALALQNS